MNFVYGYENLRLLRSFFVGILVLILSKSRIATSNRDLLFTETKHNNYSGWGKQVVNNVYRASNLYLAIRLGKSLNNKAITMTKENFKPHFFFPSPQYRHLQHG